MRRTRWGAAPACVQGHCPHRSCWLEGAMAPCAAGGACQSPLSQQGLPCPQGPSCPVLSAGGWDASRPLELPRNTQSCWPGARLSPGSSPASVVSDLTISLLTPVTPILEQGALRGPARLGSSGDWVRPRPRCSSSRRLLFPGSIFLPSSSFEVPRLPCLGPLVSDPL